MMTNALTMRNMTRAEVDELITRAAHEGWNPGLHDAELFWRTDPENNPAALRLVQQYRMREVFGCARMYLGPFPNLRHERIFGVTTFELG